MKIKIWPDSLDVNCPQPMGSFLFVKDLITYDGENFELATSMESADCVMLPHYSNYHALYIFDIAKAFKIVNLKKKVIIENTGGGDPYKWHYNEPIGEFIWGHGDFIKVYFSTECYPWHRTYLPLGIHYAPLDYVGYTDFGLRFLEMPPLQSKDYFERRLYGTHFCMNVYPPSRSGVWEILHEQDIPWDRFCHNTNPTYPPASERISWQQMTDALFKSKIGFSPDAATSKSERQIFVPAYAAMMMQDDSVEFPFEWLDGVNCIKLVHDFVDGYEKEKEMTYQINGHNLRKLNKEKTKDKILYYLNHLDALYSIYVNGWHTAHRYQLPNYYKNHIGKTIKEHL